MPTVVLRPSQDTFIDEKHRRGNFGGLPELLAGGYSADGAQFRRRSLIQFDFSSIPPGSGIIEARLGLFIFRNDAPSVPRNLDLFRVREPWREFKVNWAERPDIKPGPYARISILSERDVFLWWDVSNLVRGWFSGSLRNRGLEIKCRPESAAGLVGFMSREQADPDLRPALEVSYREAPYPFHKFTSTEETGIRTHDSYRFTDFEDVSLAEDYIYYVQNTGSNDATLKLQVCPTVDLYLDDEGDGAERRLAPGAVIALAPLRFSRYARLGYRSSVPGQATTIRIVFQRRTV